MNEQVNHIVSRFKWDTSFNDKEKANELQQRLSGWSKTSLPREIAAVCDKICPPEQTWKIQTLSLDLGFIDYQNLEFELGIKLRKQLHQQIIDHLIYSSRGSSNFEVIELGISQIELIKSFLLNGIMPWNYNTADGSVNQLLSRQLKSNFEEVIAMIRTVGITHENVRKRMAWQLNEANLVQLIEGLEPNYNPHIIEFSSELTKIQTKKNLVQANLTDFKKNLWFLVLNFLFTERGTIFNKADFLKSNIRQMAAHYNIKYTVLFDLIEQAVAEVSKSLPMQTEFITTFKILVKEKAVVPKNSTKINSDANAWQILENHFNTYNIAKSAAQKIEFNDLVSKLAIQDSSKFKALLSSFEHNDKLWDLSIAHLSEPTLAQLLKVLNPAKADQIISGIRFLKELGKATKMENQDKTLWRTGIDFLQHDQAADYQLFLGRVVSLLSNTNKITKLQLLDRLLNANIPTTAKTIAGAATYTALTSILIAEIAKKQPAVLKSDFETLFNTFVDQLDRKTIGKNELLMLQKTLVKHIQFSPKIALSVLAGYPDKNAVSRMLPYLLDVHTAKILLKNVESEMADLIQSLRNRIKEFGITSGGLSKLMNEQLTLVSLKGIILNPALKKLAFIEFIFEEFAKLIDENQLKQFGFFIENVLNDQKISRLKIQAVKKTVEPVTEQALMERVNKLVDTASINPQILSDLLVKHFSDKEFIRLRKMNQAGSVKILNYLAPGGEKIKNGLISIAFGKIKKAHPESATHQVANKLNELYWLCLLNFEAHQGNGTFLSRDFEDAVNYHFNISNLRSQIVTSGLRKDKTSVFYLKNGNKLTEGELFKAIERCFADGFKLIENNNSEFHFKELLALGSTIDPTEIGKIITGTPISNAKMLLLKNTVSLSEFSLFFAGRNNNTIKNALQAMDSLFAIVKEIAALKTAKILFDHYWMQAWKLVQTNKWSAESLVKLLQFSFEMIGKETQIDSKIISSTLHKTNISLNETLKNAFRTYDQIFTGILVKEIVNTKLLKAEERGLLPQLSLNIIAKKQVPVWFGNTNGQELKELLNELMEFYPHQLLRVIKHEVITEEQLLWLGESINFKELCMKIGNLNPDKQTLLHLIDEFYTAFQHISITGIAEKELQFILFRKVLKAWSSGNWSIIYAANIWNEMIWEVCVKRKVSKKQFIATIERKRNLLPPSLQVSFKKLIDKETQPTVTHNISKASMPVDKPYLGEAKGGIVVKNAGIILINNYITTLFDRLGLMHNRIFLDELAQASAIHYLQYAVTGLTDPDEGDLVLHKVICGWPVHQAIKKEFHISPEAKTTIEGLVSAAIAHWPAIGNCTVNGFRGNWLVREGLLVKYDDKWELTIEKRAYDLLIHKSPFSFSIIKYPWMDKPLHVNWTY